MERRNRISQLHLKDNDLKLQISLKNLTRPVTREEKNYGGMWSRLNNAIVSSSTYSLSAEGVADANNKLIFANKEELPMKRR